MIEIEDAGALRERVLSAKCDGLSVGLVPTMGYLHRGHLKLIEVARAENGLVVVSVFVNPTQFGPHEDFERYPRDIEGDRRRAAEAGTDILFAPAAEMMYPDGPGGQLVWIDPGSVAEAMEGAARPGHFRGVATVVAKLLNIVQPDRAYFGQKDAQQAVVITRMVRDLAFPPTIRILPTVREPDGLALSSRNVYLSEEERSQAVALFRALSEAKRLIEYGERDADRIKALVRDFMVREAPLGRIDYVEVADLETMQPVVESVQRDSVIALAVFFGGTRLIDNEIVRFDGASPSLS